MIAVVGHWEIGYCTPIMEASYWNFVLRDFGVSDWRMTPVSGVRHNEQQKVTLTEFHSYNEALEGCQLHRVFIEPRTRRFNPVTTWLHEYEHPDDCIYIFGSTHRNPTLGRVREEDDVVSIKSKLDSGIPWASHCLMVVLYDRMVKSWQ
jgi:hypothetical protein